MAAGKSSSAVARSSTPPPRSSRVASAITCPVRTPRSPKRPDQVFALAVSKTIWVRIAVVVFVPLQRCLRFSAATAVRPEHHAGWSSHLEGPFPLSQGLEQADVCQPGKSAALDQHNARSRFSGFVCRTRAERVRTAPLPTCPTYLRRGGRGAGVPDHPARTRSGSRRREAGAAVDPSTSRPREATP